MKSTRKILSLILILCMILSFAACSKANSGNDTDNNINSSEGNNQNTGNDSQQAVAYPMTVTDSDGREITIEKSPEKIASGAPSITEIIYALGKDKELVGVTEYCNYPEDTKNKQVIGGYTGPNVEKLIELDVDLYISDSINDDTLKTLNDAGVQVIISTAKTYQDVFTSIAFIGQLLDANEEASKLVADMKAKEADVLVKIDKASKVTAFYEIWNDPLQCAGPGSFMNDLIILAGGENIAKDAESAYAEFSLEKLIEANPQVYLSADDGFKTVDDIKARTGFEGIDAIKNNQIYLLDQDITSRPGPRIVDALEIVAKALHPEMFK